MNYRSPYWYAMGCRQLLFLVDQGMSPKHYLLDVGCGALRGGVHFMRYLNAGRYWALEKDDECISLMYDVLQHYNLDRSNLNLIERQDFVVEGAPLFDFMLLQSVFTHLDPAGIEQCLKNLLPRLLSPDGAMYATYEESDSVNVGFPHPVRTGEIARARYPFDFFVQLVDSVFEGEYSVKRIGDWGHPGGLAMMKIAYL